MEYMSIAERIERIIDRHGYQVTYTQITGVSRSGTGSLTRSNTETTHTIKAHIRDFSAKELAGNFIEMGDRQMRIAGKEIAFAPSSNDTVTHNGTTYRLVDINTRGSDLDGTLIHIIQIRG